MLSPQQIKDLQAYFQRNAKEVHLKVIDCCALRIYNLPAVQIRKKELLRNTLRD